MGVIMPLPKNAKNDFNIFVHRDSDNNLITSDDTPAAIANVDYVPEATEIVRVRIVNATKGANANGRATLYFNVSP